MASKLNRREKTLLYLLLCLAITAGTVCLLILPAVSRNAEMRDALDAAETQKMEMEIRRNTLEKTLARIEELEKEGDALYEGLFVEGIPSELYDAYLTSLALDLGITPTSLVINPVSAKTPAAYLPEEASPSASSDAKMAVRTFQIGGTASYDLFAALAAAYDAQRDCVFFHGQRPGPGSGRIRDIPGCIYAGIPPGVAGGGDPGVGTGTGGEREVRPCSGNSRRKAVPASFGLWRSQDSS